jgi:uncharacterized repeat protein (TIGR04138 family)
MEPPVFDFWEKVHALCERDPRFRREAYEFVMRALEHTTSRVVGPRRHVSGQELLAGIVDLARAEFGELAWTVFQEWGITQSEDFGAIVFALVGEGLLGRQPEDSLQDFAGGIDVKHELEPPRSPRPHPRP